MRSRGISDKGYRRLLAQKSFKVAQEEEFQVNWNDFQDIVNDLSAAVSQKDMRLFIEEINNAFDLIGMNVNFAEDETFN